MRTWLAVAAEAREFAGILKRARSSKRLEWPGAAFAREAEWKGDRWLLVANGPGAERVRQVLAAKRGVDGIVSIGFCGALDPALRVGDIVPDGLHTAGRVAVTAEEKRVLRERTGAAAVEMEAAAVAAKALEWGVPFRCVKAVSDTAEENLPLDFNRYRGRDGTFSRGRIALAALARPSATIPGLLRLDRNCRIAADKIGEFLADCTL
ncbi:MAG TPA: hypothetical protein VFW83_03365 [Bryobacteraceae bacterium]|nr:hypothetical protein [Bryobacteraceae bacterium]